MADLPSPSTGTLVPEPPCYVLCNKASGLMSVWNRWMAFASILIYYHMHEQIVHTYTQGPIDRHINIY